MLLDCINSRNFTSNITWNAPLYYEANDISISAEANHSSGNLVFDAKTLSRCSRALIFLPQIKKPFMLLSKAVKELIALSRKNYTVITKSVSLYRNKVSPFSKSLPYRAYTFAKNYDNCL